MAEDVTAILRPMRLSPRLATAAERLGRRLTAVAAASKPTLMAAYTDSYPTSVWDPTNLKTAFSMTLDDLIQYTAEQGHHLNLATVAMHCHEVDDEVYIQVVAEILS